MKDAESHQELLLRYLDGNVLPEEQARVTELLRSDPEARAFLRDVAEQAVTMADMERVGERRETELEARQDWMGNRGKSAGRKRMRLTMRRSVAVTAAVLAVVAGLLVVRSGADRDIAKITGLNGSLQWTGNGGQVFHDLSAGTELPGGTVEGMTPNSWLELEFKDSSTITISGVSMLTFSDYGQKKLYLKEGSVSGNIEPQPVGKPMIIRTRSAVLEILGTQFEVETELAETTLNVSEGKVLVRRLSDGSTVQVPAQHRVTAAADREMSPVRIPESVNRWVSQLNLGPAGTYGKWVSEREGKYARLWAIPYTVPQSITIYTAAFGVSHGDKPPVMLESSSRLRVRGWIKSTSMVWFGVTVRHSSGEFAGRFQIIRPAEEFPAGQDFEVVLDLRDFHLDPSLKKMKDKLPGDPFNLVVQDVWCHTLDKRAGLQVKHAEIDVGSPGTTIPTTPEADSMRGSIQDGPHTTDQ